MNAMTKGGIAFAILIGVSLPSSAWALSQGATCRLGARTQDHAIDASPRCWLSQDPWQDCDEDPWQLSSEIAPRDTFSDPWQDSGDPWQPFVAEPAMSQADALPSTAAEDPWQPSAVRTVKISSTLPDRDRDAIEDPWQPAVADPWQDDVEDPWQ